MDIQEEKLKAILQSQREEYQRYLGIWLKILVISLN